MTRDRGRENADLRRRLREAQSLIRVAAAALADDPARAWLAAHLAATLGDEGEPLAPPENEPREPGAGDNQ